MVNSKPLLLLMDGHAMVYRAWYAIQQPMNIGSTGEEVRGVYGFINTFLRTLSDWNPTHCAISFDLSRPTFRHKVFDEYKAQRPPSPPELRAQFPHVRRIMKAFGVPVFELEGYEADDVLGTLCRYAEEMDVETVVVTGDTDELQLVSPLVRVSLTHGVQKKNVYGVEEVEERFEGLGPDLVADIKALQGDASDNIPGVPGIGKKTAIKLLGAYGSIEGIYEHIDEVYPPRIQQNLRDNEDLANHNKFLTTIVRDVPLEFNFEDTRFWQYDRSKVVELLRDLEFFSIVSRIPDPNLDATIPSQTQMSMELSVVKTDYRVVDTVDDLKILVDELDDTSGFSLVAETTPGDPMESDLVGLSFSNGLGRAWYVPVGHREGRQIELKDVAEEIKSLMISPLVPKVTHNANYQSMVLQRYGIVVNNISLDTSLAGHLCGWPSIELKQMALRALGIEILDSSNLAGVGKNQTDISDLGIDVVAKYSSARVDAIFQLHRPLMEELERKGGIPVFRGVEMPLFPVLVRMQQNGVSIDSDLLKQMSEVLSGQIADIENEVHGLLGHEFNLKSSKQLGDVLFTELRLPHAKRTQKGSYSTDAFSLDAIRQMILDGGAEDADPRGAQILDSVSEYRQLTKIKSTYVDSLPGLVNRNTNRIHTRYNQTGSATGRVSSNDPNVQNIPVRTELGRRVRMAFTAERRPEWTLLAADYSQIELRILAHLSQDLGLIMAFQDGQDIHASTASSVYGVPVDMVQPEMRRIAKIMNFGVVYGLSSFGISQQTGLTIEEGRDFIQAYFGKYPGIRNYVEVVKARVTEQGYVETIMGRRRYIPEVRSTNSNVRTAGERMAINMPIQGTAADILKIAMIRIQQRLDELNLCTMMILQVHDELIFEVPLEEVEEIKNLVLQLMPSAMTLLVPLEVEVKTGDTWGQMD